ncbi:MAG: hypothetical protein K9N10_00625 [Deltaproteobacteria bacterium]|nr:hypothetical protein [Deltaproteobacteria bacterium]
MEKRRFKKIAVTIALIGALFMFGTGVKKAESAYIDDAGYYGIVAEFYKGYAIYYTGIVFEGYGLDNLYTAYQYYDYAATYAYNAYSSATYSGNAYAYDAYMNAYNAYTYLDAAASYAYYAWYYDDTYYTGVALDYAGLANTYLALLAYYAAYLQ